MNKRIIAFILVCSFHNALAGAMGYDTGSFGGFWIGVGGSYTSSQLNGQTTIQTQPPISAPGTYILSNGHETHFAPVANIGYLHEFKNNWLGGLRAQYKYIGIEQFDINWSGTLQNGAYETSGIHSKFQDDWLLLVEVGHSFEKWVAYGGIGPALFNVSTQLNGDTLPAGSFNFFPVNLHNSKSLWGGGGHVGVAYMLPQQLTVDLSYNFAISQSENVPTLISPSGNPYFFSAFVQNLQAVEQGVNITLNKYINF